MGIIINVFDQTAGISQKGFGLPLVFSNSKDISYQEVASAGDIVGVTGSDTIYKKVNQIFAQSPSVETVAVYGVDVVSASSTITDELNNLILTNNNWFWLLIDSDADADITEISNWIAGKSKYAVCQTPGDVSASISLAGGINNKSMALVCHDKADEYVDACIVGKVAPMKVGSYTLMYKKLNGITANGYNTTEESSLLDANINVYSDKGGVAYYKEGKSATPEVYFSDTKIAIEYAKAKYREGLLLLMTSQDKVPLDDAGIAQIVSEIKDLNVQLANAGIVAQDEDGNFLTSIEYPNRNEISANDKANRKLTIKVSVTFSGAVHDLTVDFYLVL